MSQLIRFISLFLFAVQMFACSPKEKSQFVRFSGESTQQKWAVKDLNPDLPSDWSTYNYLTFKLKASSTQYFYLSLYDAEGVSSSFYDWNLQLRFGDKMNKDILLRSNGSISAQFSILMTYIVIFPERPEISQHSRGNPS